MTGNLHIGTIRDIIAGRWLMADFAPKTFTNETSICHGTQSLPTHATSIPKNLHKTKDLETKTRPCFSAMGRPPATNGPSSGNTTAANSGTSSDSVIENGKAESNYSSKKKRSSWGLMELLVVLIGGSVVVSTLFNLLHTLPDTQQQQQGQLHGRVGTAMHAHLSDFKQTGTVRKDSNREEEEADGHHGTFQEVNHIGGLSCADHGGPMESEATNEMVYW